MRIAVWYNLPSGGGKRALYHHVKGLVERGHVVKVWCPPTADRAYLPLSAFAEERVVPLQWRPVRPGGPLTSRVVRRLFRPYFQVIDSLAAMDDHCRSCAEEINRGDYDLAFVNTCRQFHTSPISRYLKIPAVLYLQEPCRGLYEPRPTLPWAAPADGGEGFWRSLLGLRGRVREWARTEGLRVQVREEASSARACRMILVNSLFSRESVLRTYGLESKVCYLGIDTDLFRHQCLPREDFVVGLGAFITAKNIGIAIEALAQLAPPRPRLVWIGNNQDAAYEREMVALAAAREVPFEPRLLISDEELVRLLNTASLMVYAPRLEPFGFAPLEANACGLPVVAVAEGGVRETIEDGRNGLVVEHDPGAIAGAIDRLRRDRDLARKLGEYGASLVRERWTWNDALDRLESRFAEVLGSEAR